MALREVAVGEHKSVHQLAQEKWRSSGLTDQQARRLKLRGLSADQVAAKGGDFYEAAGLYIPYFDLKGHPTKFFRVRYLEPLPGFAGQLKKPPRFTQLRALNEVYLPPMFKVTWEKIAQSPETELYITEGELKAAAGCAAGLATLGVGGVDVWRSAKRGVTFLPMLAAFEWADREVRIVYDSDVATKPDVIRAQRALAQELLARGARVEIVNIPPGPGEAKQGLDDFLVREGGDKLKELVAAAVPFPESDALWGMNEEVLYVKSMDSVIERATGQIFERHKFTGGIYANRHYMETQVKKKQVSLLKKPLAPHWVEWEQRSQVERLTYEPGQPHDYQGMWNVWPGWGVEPKKGDIDPWLWLMDYLFKDETKTRRWFERWAAYPLQHPGTKLYSAMLIWSRVKRLGKSLAFYSLAKIYGDNAVEINNKSIKSDFNSWAKNRQFVHANEIRGSEAKIDADWLKNIITSPKITINEKFVPQYTIDNHMNHGFESNHPDALFIEDGDQRYTVHEVIGNPAPREKYEWFDRWMHSTGPSHLFRYLLDLNLGNFNPREHALDTPGKRNMVMLGKNDTAYWVQLLQDDPVQALKPLGDGISLSCDLYTPRKLFQAFDPGGRSKGSEASLGRALAAGGFRQLNHGIPLRTSVGLCRLYPIRNVVQWEQATKKEILDHFERYWALDSGERKQ